MLRLACAMKESERTDAIFLHPEHFQMYPSSFLDSLMSLKSWLQPGHLMEFLMSFLLARNSSATLLSPPRCLQRSSMFSFSC